MSDFDVQTEDLLSLVSVLRSLLQELSDAGGSTPDCNGMECPDVEDQFHHFFSDWSEGLAKIQTNFSKLTDRLEAAGKGYEGVDNSIVNALHGS